jgi:preprotein translocase subunit SecG
MVFISILIIVVCILLVLIVLVQNSKGGGLASNFSSQNQVMGVRKTTDFLEKATWILAIVVFALSLTASGLINRGGETVEDQKHQVFLNSAASPSKYSIGDDLDVPQTTEEEAAE